MAANALAPAVVEIRLQLPEATVPIQVSNPSLTVTLPVGVPPALGVTLKVTAYGWPTRVLDASALALVMAVVVAYATTVWSVYADVLELKEESPVYEAESFFIPEVKNVIEQLPVATLPVQLSEPSEMITLPVGVPLPGAAAATLKLMVTG